MKNLTTKLDSVREAFASVFKKRKTRIIDSLPALEEFTATRAAFIAQKTLYGYTKTRMGTSFPEMFRDPMIIHSLNIAKMHHFAECLSDLCVFVTGQVLAGEGFSDPTRRALAVRLYDLGLDANLEHTVDEFDPADARKRFEQRVNFVDWSGTFDIRDAFTHSQQSIIRWAPIADELKALDRDIVENSVRFAWIEVRQQFDKVLRLEPTRGDIMKADLVSRAPAPQAGC
jgi:hypothetical protein